MPGIPAPPKGPETRELREGGSLWGFVVVILVSVLLVEWAAWPTSAAELRGSQALTIERSDDGDVYAALSVVLEYELAPDWSAVLIHDQAVSLPSDRYTEWDTSIAWHPGPGWSLSVGRRWRIGPPPDYGGPWTYVQIWRGM